MRVCLLSRRITREPRTGYERYSSGVYEGLIKRDFEVELLCQNFRVSPFHSIFSPIFYDVLSLPLVLLLRKIGRRAKIDVYHATFPDQGLYFPFFLRRNTVVTFHDIWGISDLGNAIRSRRILDSFWAVYNRVTSVLALKYAGHIITLSEQSKNEVLSLVKVPEEKVTVIPHSVNDCFKPMRNGRNEIPVLGYVGQSGPRKEIDYLIRAFHILKQRHPDFKCKLQIWGVTQGYKGLCALVSQLHLDGVEFKGRIPEEKIVETYNNFDLFVLPSSHEGFGLPIIEAQRCGLPVLIRTDAKIPQETREAAIQCSSEEDMADRIYALLTNQNLYQEISRKGLDYSKQFTGDRHIEETIKVYDKVSTEAKC